MHDDSLRSYAKKDVEATEAMHASIHPKWFPPDPSEGAPIVPLRRRARKLHPMQWVTYIIVIITCVAVLFSLLNTYLFLNDLQNAVSEFGRSFTNNLIGE